MSQSKTSQITYLDCHVHYGDPSYKDGLIRIMDDLGVDKFNIVCTPHPSRLSLVPDALHLKAHYPDRTYVFGGMDISAFFTAGEKAGFVFADYVETLLGMGCDGIKMIEGKPDMRKMLNVPPFDGHVYKPFWEKMESSQTPLIFHVNDPAEFWDAIKIPDWARESGWFYGDGTFINNETQYTEILKVLSRHPRLNVVFAHFFFLSQDLPRLAGYLDQFPGMRIDLTPGIEMYHEFSKNPEVTRDFFTKYQDRILFGTDIGAKALLTTPEKGIEVAESRIRFELVKKFLETEGEFSLDPSQGYLFNKFEGNFKGIHLPLGVLEKISHANFEKLAGKTPKKLNPEKIIPECERLALMVVAMGAARPGEPGDPSVAKEVRKFFEDFKN
jgi:predicted TIM-barrel fold metal-dependent hydrolase